MLMPQTLDKMLLLMQMTQSNIVSSYSVSNVKDEFNPGGCLHDHDILEDYIYGKLYNVSFLKEYDIHFNNFDEVYFNILAYSLCPNEAIYNIKEPLYYWNTDEPYITNYRNYIMSVYHAFEKLFNSNFGFDLCVLLGFLFKTYNYYEILKVKQYKNLSTLDNYISKIINNKQIQKALCDKNIWKLQSKYLMTTNQDTNSIIIYPDSFIQWLHNFGYIKLKEEI